MSGKFFLDTNIFVYSYLEDSHDKGTLASKLIRDATFGGGVVSYQVVQEFFNVVLGKAKPRMRHADAQDYLETVFRPLLHVHSSAALMSEAIEMQGRYRLGWYDSLIVSAALQARCGILYTEDMQHGQKFGQLVVRNPFL